MLRRLILVLFLSGNSSGCTRTRVEYVKIPAKPEPCLKVPPEELRAWDFDDGGTGKCDPSYDVCLSQAAAAALEQNLRYLLRRVRDDWALCGPKEQ